MNTTIFYHGADHDGHCSGAIAQLYYQNKGITPVMIPIDYGHKIPDVTGQNIIIVDFSFQPEAEMINAVKTAASVIWIDHHISAINKFGNLGLKGIRDTQYSACELTWKYFFGVSVLPRAVEFLGKYDSWRHEDNEDIIGFEYFMQSIDTDPRTFNWTPYFKMSDSEIFDKAAIGKIIRQRDNRLNAIYLRNAYEKDILGLRCLCLNTTSKSSLVFGDKIDQYDACVVYYRMSSGNYSCSLYASGKTDVDVSALASKFGGGGHKKAAGMRISKEKYEQLFG